MDYSYRKIVFTKVPPSVSKTSRRFFDRHVRRAFVQYVAYVGLFDGVLTEQEIENAKDGILPKDLDIHHIVPLSGSTSLDINAFTNLTVLHKSTHIHINRKIFEPQLKDLPEGKSREIDIPEFEMVDADRIIAIRAEKLRESRVPIKRSPYDMRRYKGRM